MPNQIPSEPGARPAEPELSDDALEEVAGGLPDAPVIEIGPPPFLPVIDCV